MSDTQGYSHTHSLMIRSKNILPYLLLLASSALCAQYTPEAEVKKMDSLTVVLPNFSLLPINTGIHRSTSTPTAFFCKLELKMDKSSKLPVRMRLGTLEYVNALESKNTLLDKSLNKN